MPTYRRSVFGLLVIAFSLGALPAVAAGKPVRPTYTPGKPGPLLQRFLAGPLACGEVIFAERRSMRDHWYVNFGYYSNEPERPGYGEGGRLCRLDLRSGKLTVLLDDPRGGVRDPQLHYDGEKVLFSYRRGGTPTYHLYEIGVDGRNLRQLTDGADDDIEPTYCPDGSIVFGSSRCRRFVNCWFSRVTTLYRCRADGAEIRMLSSNNDHDNTPWMLPDGRVLYMRWEYVDRSQLHYHHLWTTNPDGTSQMVFFGNEYGGTVMLDAKPIPGTNKIVASFSPGHGRPEHVGPVTVVDPAAGPDMPSRARQVSKDGEWRDPYALSEDCFLAANRQGIFVMDAAGETELVYRLEDAAPDMECHEPRPLAPRPREAVLPERTDLAKATARMILEDVYAGRGMEGVARGEVKKLLVLQQVPKPVNFSGGMEPLTIGGSFTLAEILGTVPVEEDGSAYIEAPALRSLFFVALDKDDLSVKRMQSFAVLQPGETVGCVGCHEQRNRPPHPLPRPAALARRPSRIEPIAGVPAVIDFPRDIQPILDRRCVECHNPERFAGRFDFSGDRTPMYTVSYWSMQRDRLVSDGRNQPQGNRPPRSIGSSNSRLLTLVDGSHHGVRCTPEEKQLLRLWIETGATYPGTYASLGCGDYPAHLPWGVLHGRCGECHGRETVDKKRKKIYLFDFGPLAKNSRIDPLCNLSRPEKSHLLRAPLARTAGGLELCKRVVFGDRDDKGYRQLLASIEDAGRRLAEGKRFDMPGFRPNEHYLREMQRFGILPTPLPAGPIDPYRTDRSYWNSFVWQPHGE